MNETNGKTLVEQISELKENADRYSHLKDRFDNVASRLKNVIDELNNIISDISITPVKQRTSGFRRESIEPILEWCLRMMQSGQYVGLEDIRKAFPDLTDAMCSWIFYTGIHRLDNKGMMFTKVDGKRKYYILKS